MMWRDTVDLISVAHSDAATVIVTEASRTIYANRKSIARSEFYQAIANNLKPTVTFEIRFDEYQGEQKLRHEGNDYLIIRTFSKNNETIDLICQAFHDVQTNLAQLRDMVEIWHNTFVENSMGEMTLSPALLYTVPAHIEFKGGGNTKVDGLVETTNNATITIHYREDITSDLYLKIEGRRWDIRFIEDPYNRHETLILTVEKVI